MATTMAGERVDSDKVDDKDPNGKDNNDLIFWHNNQTVVGCIPGREGGLF